MNHSELFFIIGGYILAFLILICIFNTSWLIIILLPLFFYLYFYYYRVVKKYNIFHLYIITLILVVGISVMFFM